MGVGAGGKGGHCLDILTLSRPVLGKIVGSKKRSEPPRPNCQVEDQKRYRNPGRSLGG